MYLLKKEVYLDQFNECYKHVIVISPKPQEKSLLEITKLVQREKLSPFQQRSACCPEDQCYYIILNPKNTCEFLCINNITLLFNYLFFHGFKIDTSVTKVMQMSDAKINDLICFISK